MGFPGYVYPNQEICDTYDGVPCENDSTACCYNISKWCSDPDDPGTCSNIDNGAYPFGDKRQFIDQQFNPQALSPFPNAIYFNWATLIILALGNLAAIDFQVRFTITREPREESGVIRLHVVLTDLLFPRLDILISGTMYGGTDASNLDAWVSDWWRLYLFRRNSIFVCRRPVAVSHYSQKHEHVYGATAGHGS